MSVPARSGTLAEVPNSHCGAILKTILAALLISSAAHAVPVDEMRARFGEHDLVTLEKMQEKLDSDSLIDALKLVDAERVKRELVLRAVKAVHEVVQP